MNDGRYLLTAQEDLGVPSRYPTVSFCIPTRNRAAKLERTLKSLRSLVYPQEIEIVVVDNGSSDNTREVANAYADCVICDEGTLGSIRQKSVDLSTGEVLGIIDDDLYMTSEDWLLRAVAQFQLGERVSTIWPRLVPPPGATAVTRCFFALNQAIFEDRMLHQRGVFGGGNSLFSRQAVHAVGGFDVHVGFGEDMLLAKKLRDGGYQVVYYPEPAIHDSMFSLAEIYRKQVWGSKAVEQSGIELMQQPWATHFYEQFLLGTRAMCEGLLRGDASWLAFPPIVAAKALAYARSFLRSA